VTLVVDASVSVQWVLLEAQSDAANALRLTGEPLIAPELVYAEIGNAIWKRVVRRELSTADATEALGAAAGVYATLIPIGELAVRAIEIAVDLQHPIYDCFYLALAERERCAMVTADKRLLTAVKKFKGAEVRAL
jgi:predicted nucleic acid-binding protein